MGALLSQLATTPSASILDALRGLERKTSLVHTLLKASVYSIVLNQQMQDQDQDQDDAQSDGGGIGGGSGMGYGAGV